MPQFDCTTLRTSPPSITNRVPRVSCSLTLTAPFWFLLSHGFSLRDTLAVAIPASGRAHTGGVARLFIPRHQTPTSYRGDPGRWPRNGDNRASSPSASRTNNSSLRHRHRWFYIARRPVEVVRTCARQHAGAVCCCAAVFFGNGPLSRPQKDRKHPDPETPPGSPEPCLSPPRA